MSIHTSKKQKSSRMFVDQHGHLKIHYSSLEKIYLKIIRPFQTLPFMVSFILCILFMAEIVCLLGLIFELHSPHNTLNIGIYLFLVAFIGMVTSFGLGIGWLIAEYDASQNSKYPKTDINQKNHEQDKMND